MQAREKKSDRYLFQYHVSRGLDETKLLRRSLHSAWKHGNNVHEENIYGTWLRMRAWRRVYNGPTLLLQ
jgi:hypothetical protein